MAVGAEPASPAIAADRTWHDVIALQPGRAAASFAAGPGQGGGTLALVLRPIAALRRGSPVQLAAAAVDGPARAAGMQARPEWRARHRGAW